MFLCFFVNLCFFPEVPEIKPISVSDSYNEGSVVTISCTATGNPEPDVEWKRDGKVRVSGKSTASLTFSSINKTDAGTYTCTDRNREGTTDYQVTVVVNCKYLITWTFGDTYFSKNRFIRNTPKCRYSKFKSSLNQGESI